MVDRESATGGRYTSDPESTIQIDEDHSNMVKFPLGDHRISIIINKLRDVCWPNDEGRDSVDSDQSTALTGFSSQFREAGDGTETSLDSMQNQPGLQWDHDLILQSLEPPDRETRLEQIDKNFGHSFNWAYDDPSAGLTAWLRRGSGIFWISGKPGSGKSTLMKFLLNDPRTTELLHNWRSKAKQIIVNFFFHHRGTLLQKSFDGLLRSLLSQLLEREERLRSVVIDAMLDARLHEKLRSEKQGTLQSDIKSFLQVYGIKDKADLYQRRLNTLLSRDPIMQLQVLLKESFPSMEKVDELSIKRIVLGDFRRLSNAIGARETLDREVEKVWRKIRWIEMDKLGKLIMSWCTYIDYDILIRDFLMEHNLYKGQTKRPRDAAGYTTEAWIRENAKQQQLEEYIRELARRQRLRQEVRLNIQLSEWTRSELEDGVSRAFDQNVFDLEVCLFFDALDEYDGSPEVISEFLKDIIQKSPSSKTQAKVLFSSRPWPIFSREFGAYAGFKIHERTQEDIREFCTGFMPAGSAAKRFMLPLAEEIVNRARGVFLWVKLVMRDLSNIANRHDVTLIELPSRLRQCLDSVPDELEDYYSTIVRRLPSNTRIETYILLECLSRSTRSIYLNELQTLMKCALARSFDEAMGRNASHTQARSRSETDAYLRTISGGLVDVGGEEMPSTESEAVNPRIQLLHQTCKEWVESVEFKHVVLGDRANMTWENGHSFLVKFYSHLVMKQRIHISEIFAHVREAERTTGVSQHRFLALLPADFYDKGFMEEFPAPIKSGLRLAVFNGLWLYLKDSVQHDRYVIKAATEPLFAVLLGRLSYGQKHQHPTAGRQAATAPEVTEMGHYLLENGFNLEQDAIGVSTLMVCVWSSPDRENAALFMNLVKAGVRTSLPLEASFPGAFDYFSPGALWKLLHVSPPPLARWLLEYGAAVNAINSKEQTALDYLLDPQSVHQTSTFGVDWLYELACLLVQHGGVLRRCTHHHLEDFRRRVADSGFDLGPLASLHLPPTGIQPQMMALQQQMSALKLQMEAQQPHMNFPLDVPRLPAVEAPSAIRLRKRDRLKQFIRMKQ